MAQGPGRRLGGGAAVTTEPPPGAAGRGSPSGWARPRCPPCPARPAVTRWPRREEPPPSAPAITKLCAGPGRRRRLPAHGTAAAALSPASTPGRATPPQGAGTAATTAGSGDSAAATASAPLSPPPSPIAGLSERTGQSGEGRPEAAEPEPMCPRSRRGDEAAMSAADRGTLRPWKPDPGQADGGRPPPGPGPLLPLTLSVLAWLGTGTTMAGLNKWIFAAHGFRYPLLLSALHMLSGVAVGYPLGWARAPGPRPRARIYLLSLTFCTSVALGNLGLSYVQLDVAQAVATTTPLVTLVLGVLGGRRPHPLQFWAMGPVCAGAACSIAGGLCFSQPGCGFLLAATVLRALKSIQQSVLLQEDRLDALSLLGLTSLPSFVLLFGAAVALELGPSWQAVLRADAALWGCVLLSCLGSVLYNLATSCLLSLTSALTLHLLGSLTVVGNLLLSRLLFGTRLGALGYAGVALTLAGMVLYHQPRLLAACWGLRGLRRHPRHE